MPACMVFAKLVLSPVLSPVLRCMLRLQVTVATEERMRGLVEGFGLSFACIAGDPTGLLLEPHAQVRTAWHSGGGMSEVGGAGQHVW